VPNYPGLLTASEYKAYNVAVPLVAEEVRLFNERANTLSEIESKAPKSPSKLPHKQRTACNL